MEQQQYRHYVSMDLYGNGVAYDVLIVNEDKSNGDVYFIKVEDLDDIDRKRVRQILTKRNANTMPLWDVMSQVTLKNGMNALEYFHQLVKIKTKSGQIISPSASRRGMGIARRAIQPQKEAKAPPKDGSSESAPKKRGPGRPPKNSS
jgi:hypothetical protein